LRASKGAISSGETFWLMAAMRKNERIGPGTAIVALAAGDGGGTETSDGGGPEGVAF
jgi:hypothetical protein